MKNVIGTATSTKRIELTRRSPQYWRVTLNHPPLNVFGPESIPQLNEIVTALETDKEVKVVVFDSAVEGFFLTHYDLLTNIKDTTALPPGPTGLQPLPDMLVRLSRASVVSIASIRGRATGVGSELALACDMRFASREKAILSQWEVGAGIVPGGGPMARLPRLMGRGRALEVLLGADDIPGDLAERYVPCLDHAASRAREDQDVNGAGISPAGWCGRPLGILRRPTRALSLHNEDPDVTPCFRSGFRISPRRRAVGHDRPLCVQQTGRSKQVDHHL